MARPGHELFNKMIEFIGAHGNELTPHDIFIVGAAAGIIDRITAPPLIDVELPPVRPE